MQTSFTLIANEASKPLPESGVNLQEAFAHLSQGLAFVHGASDTADLGKTNRDVFMLRALVKVADQTQFDCKGSKCP